MGEFIEIHLSGGVEAVCCNFISISSVKLDTGEHCPDRLASEYVRFLGVGDNCDVELLASETPGPDSVESECGEHI